MQTAENIEKLINESEDNRVIQLGEEYSIQENTTLKINKSITLNGAENKTIIDGNSNYLYLDTYEKEKPKIDSELPVLYDETDELKNNGKHVIFNNITFININIETWHDMEFNNCDFIDSTFTSHELDNKFNNCIFNNSIMQLTVLMGYNLHKIPPAFSEILNCQFYESEIKTEIVYSSVYRQALGGDFFMTFNNVTVANSNFYKSKLSINNIKLHMRNDLFNATNITGHSNSIDIQDGKFFNQNIDLLICKTKFINSIFKKSDFNMEATYFSIGTSTSFKNCNLKNSNIKITPGLRSKTSEISLIDSNIENSSIDTSDTSMTIKNSILNKTEMSLLFTYLRINDTIIFNNNNLDNTIKTILQENKSIMTDGSNITKTFYYPMKTDYQVTNTTFVNESGKYQLNSKDISKDTLYNFTFKKQDIYYVNNELIFVLKDSIGKPVSGMRIYLDISEENTPRISMVSDENGIVKYKLNKNGDFKIHAYYYTDGVKYDTIYHGMTFNISVKPIIIKDLKISKLNFKTNSYSSIKSSLKLNLNSKNNTDLSNIKVIIKLTGKNINKTYFLKTDSKGITKFNIPAKLSAGNYKIKIKVENSNITKNVDFKINKAKTIVKIKKSNSFKIILKNKVTKKPISRVNVKIKVYTGEKFKIYSVKTDKNGKAKLNTKKLKVGKHKVVIFSGDNNYKISAKNTIKIKK